MAQTMIVLKQRKKKGKRKRKYSRGLKKVQIGGRHGLKGANRIVDAIAKGITRFRKRSDKSSRKKRDGLFRDLTLNVGRGAGRTLRVSSAAPRELAKALQGQGLRKPNQGLARLLRGVLLSR
jgi:hypothetical protein